MLLCPDKLMVCVPNQQSQLSLDSIVGLTLPFWGVTHRASWENVVGESSFEETWTTG
jgi:hypothetical protein